MKRKRKKDENLESKDLFFSNLNDRMHELNITKKELADRTGIGYETLKSYVAFSDAPIPSLEKALKIAIALEMSLDELCGRDDIYPINQKHDLQSLLYNLSLLVKSDFLSIKKADNQYVLTSDDKKIQSFLSTLDSTQPKGKDIWEIIKPYHSFSILDGKIDAFTNEEIKIYYLLKPLRFFENETIKKTLYDHLTTFEFLAMDSTTDQENIYKLEIKNNRLNLALSKNDNDDFIFRLIKHKIDALSESLEIHLNTITILNMKIPDISPLEAVDAYSLENYIDALDDEFTQDLIRDVMSEIKHEEQIKRDRNKL